MILFSSDHTGIKKSRGRKSNILSSLHNVQENKDLLSIILIDIQIDIRNEIEIWKWIEIWNPYWSCIFFLN